MKRILTLCLPIFLLSACARSTPRPSASSACAPGFVQGNYAYVGFGNEFVVAVTFRGCRPGAASRLGRDTSPMTTGHLFA